MIKVLYAGSPDASADTLQILLNESLKCPVGAEYRIAGVITNLPSSQGRHKDLIPTAVEQITRAWNEAQNDNIPVFTPEHLDSALREEIAPLGCDIFVCFAYGHIFGPKFLAMFPMGGVNLHPSLLPKYRGCTPVNAAILNDDKETGYTIQKVSLATDEGDILLQEKTDLTGTETAESLLKFFAKKGADGLVKLLQETARSNQLPDAVPQSGEVSYCPLMKKEDGKIDWKQSAFSIDAKIRAYTPWPGCFTTSGGLQLKILKGTAAAKLYDEKTLIQDTSAVPGTVLAFDKQKGILIQCGNGILIVRELQLQGKKAMDYKSFMNGIRDFTGSVLE